MASEPYGRDRFMCQKSSFLEYGWNDKRIPELGYRASTVAPPGLTIAPPGRIASAHERPLVVRSRRTNRQFGEHLPVQTLWRLCATRLMLRPGKRHSVRPLRRAPNAARRPAPYRCRHSIFRKVSYSRHSKYPLFPQTWHSLQHRKSVRWQPRADVRTREPSPSSPY